MQCTKECCVPDAHYSTGDYNEETQAVTNTTLISAAEYRYDGGRQRYMVRLRDPNDDLAIIGDAQWRDYIGNDIHRDYTVDYDTPQGSTVPLGRFSACFQ